MGCNISNRVAVTQLSSEELQNNQEAKSQTKNDSIAGTEAVPSQDGAAWPTGTSKAGAKLEDETSEGHSPEELPERFTSSQKSSNAQSTDTLLTSEFISKSWPLQETERQKSSDILEELRMQGIIKSQSTAARTGEVYENKRDVLEKTLKKPPARLEKIQFGNKEAGDFTAKDMKTSAEEKKQDCPSFESQGGTDTPQPSPLDGEPVVLLKEVTAVEATNNYTEDSAIESDTLQLYQ
ncbi:stathmin domain-containing protein 1 [Nyctibius grandis]|uniref:stathmin domain-containing protein 1 n=1 Tax=Nyctibius grandis TaxID=48427 RepID=UPI0035BBB8BD